MPTKVQKRKVLYKRNLFAPNEVNVEKLQQMVQIVEKEGGLDSEATAQLKALSERHFISVTPPQKGTRIWRNEFPGAICQE